MVKLLIKLFYLVTVITTLTTTLSGGIAANNNKYNSIVFCLQKHPANSLTRLRHQINTFYDLLNTVSALNRSLKARTESDDGIQDLYNIETVGNDIINSLGIVHLYNIKTVGNDIVNSLGIV